MTHDPMCPSFGNPPWFNTCQCVLIAKVRADERRQSVERVRAKKGKSPSTRLDWDTIVIAILDGTKLKLSKKELNEQA